MLRSDLLLAKFIYLHSIHDFERDLAKLIINGVPLSLDQRVSWNKFKLKYVKK